jgi:DnaJ-domain-containing protein 1
VNEGYKILTDPIKRGDYFMSLFNEKTETQVSSAFLMEVMDIQDEVSGTDDPGKLAVVKRRLEGMLADLQKGLSEALRVVDGRVRDGKVAGECLTKMKYLTRVLATLKEKLPVDM